MASGPVSRPPEARFHDGFEAGIGKVNLHHLWRLQIVLDLPLRFVILKGVPRTLRHFLPVLLNLRPRLRNSLRIEQLSGWAGHLFG
jgi:hypothetical protein